MKMQNSHYKRNDYCEYLNYSDKSICGHSMESLELQYGLPLHILFGEKIENNLVSYKKVFEQYYPKGEIYYAAKSYCSVEVLNIVKQLGCGVDVSSYNELQIAEKAGIAYDKLVLNGNAKSDELIHYAIEHNILFIIDSIYEYNQVYEISKKMNKKANCLLRISGFGTNNETDECILTSGEWTKFGIQYEEAYDFLENHRFHDEVDILGFHVHIGSQIGSCLPYLQVLEKIFILAEVLKHNGISLRMLDIGGGFPISYLNKNDWTSFLERMNYCSKYDSNSESFVWKNNKEDYVISEQFFAEYAKSEMLAKILTSQISVNEKLMTTTEALQYFGEPILLVEPGRSIVGDAGITIVKVNGVKQILNNNLLVLEMGVVNYAGSVIHNLVNKWDILEEKECVKDDSFETYICGNLCYNGDMISRYKVPFFREPERGEHLIIYDTGSTESHFFASNANMNPIPTRLLIDKNANISLVKQRQKLDEIVNIEG